MLGGGCRVARRMRACAWVWRHGGVIHSGQTGLASRAGSKKNGMTVGMVCAIALLSSCGPEKSDDSADIVGAARIVDGDTLVVGGTRVRIFGIDAPERDQTCRDAAGRDFVCGPVSRAALAAIIDRRPVRCTVLDTDRFGRRVARCRAGETDIAAAMVEQGMAFAYRRYSRDYVRDENSAQRMARGFWGGSFDYPWDWRRGNG